MKILAQNIVLLGFSLYLVSALPAELELEPRVVCNADLCLRGLRATQRDPASASAYCSSIGVRARVTSTVTEYSSTTTQLPIETITIATLTVTSGTQCYETTTDSATTEYLKRALSTPTPISAIVAASCGPSSALSSRISSACSCFMTDATTQTTTIVATITNPPIALPITQIGPYTTTNTIETCSETITVVKHPQVKGDCTILPDPFSPFQTVPTIKYNTRCGWLWFGGEQYTITRFITESFARCIRSCSNINGCVAVNYQRQSINYGTCWLYNAQMPQGENGYDQSSFDSAALVQV